MRERPAVAALSFSKQRSAQSGGYLGRTKSAVTLTGSRAGYFQTRGYAKRKKAAAAGDNGRRSGAHSSRAPQKKLLDPSPRATNRS